MDLLTRNKMLVDHFDWMKVVVRTLARQFPAVDLDDLESDVQWGLMLAARRYRPEVGAFSTFAYLVMRYQVLTCIAHRRWRSDRVDQWVKIPSHLPCMERMEFTDSARQYREETPEHLYDVRDELIFLLQRIKSKKQLRRILLCYLQELRTAEVAELEGVDASRIRHSCIRALREMRKAV